MIAVTRCFTKEAGSLTRAAAVGIAFLSKKEEDALDLEDEKRWDALFAQSEDFLAELADRALANLAAGRTRPLNFDDL